MIEIVARYISFFLEVYECAGIFFFSIITAVAIDHRELERRMLELRDDPLDWEAEKGGRFSAPDLEWNPSTAGEQG